MRQRWLVISGSAVALVVAIGLIFALVRRDDSDSTPSSPDASPTPSATAPTPIPVAFESSEGKGMTLPGRLLEARPESVFPPWTGTNAVIYDTQTGRTIDLGPGDGISFSPDGKYAAWKVGPRDTAGFGSLRVGEMRIVTLDTGRQRVIGPGIAVVFPNNEVLALQLPRTGLEDAKWQLLDIEDLQPSADQQTSGKTPYITSTGHILESLPVQGTDLLRGGHGSTHFQVFDPRDHHLVMEFDACRAVNATATQLVVASAWTEIPNEPFRSQVVQLYYLDVTTGQARWFAFARASTPNWNLTANDKYVLWTNDFCAEDGFTQPILLDRATGTGFGILRADGEDFGPGSDAAWLRLTPSALIAEGTFGATALIDPTTLKYVAVLPRIELIPALQNTGPVQPTWSIDFRYAAYWQGGGHGGLC